MLGYWPVDTFSVFQIFQSMQEFILRSKNFNFSVLSTGIFLDRLLRDLHILSCFILLVLLVVTSTILAVKASICIEQACLLYQA
jgi:hypothetical protein